MIQQSDQPSNQYGFYAVPKSVQPKKKYRQVYQEQNQYDDEEDMDDENLFEELQHQIQNQKDLDRDYYVDQAPYPDFKPKQRGLDYGVQIQKQDLFDFDMQVQPLIQILVGRSVVTAINQLQQDKQQKQKSQSLNTYQKKRNAELMVTQRLETKSNRKKQQVQRRILQKNMYIRNKKQATKKLVSRKNAKHSLLNLKTQVLSELCEDGYLREQTYLSLRVGYQAWLYEQIKDIIDEEVKINNTVDHMIKDKQNQIKKQHQKNIDCQNQRRKKILDEREEKRKQNQQRKQKKKIRKERLQLNKQRVEKADRAVEQVLKYEPVQKILKSANIADGLTSKNNTPGSVHITGGLLNFILAYLQSSQQKFGQQQIQSIFLKLLKQLQCKLQVQLSAQHHTKIQQLRTKQSENGIQFMKTKQQKIKQLCQQISLDLSLLEQAKCSVSSNLHNGILSTILSIALNCLPEPIKQGEQIISQYEPTQDDKKKQEYKTKIQLCSQQQKYIDKIGKVDNVVRVRFQKIRPQKKVQQSSQNAQQSKPVDLDEWIDIYDGQGWQQSLKQVQKDAQRDRQSGAAYCLPSFDNALIVDERNLSYLCSQMEKVMDVKAGKQLQNYISRLNYVRKSQNKIAIYDVQLEWQ